MQTLQRVRYGCVSFFLLFIAWAVHAEPPVLLNSTEPCVAWGAGKLEEAFRAAPHTDGISEVEVSIVASPDTISETARKPEGYRLSRNGNRISISGFDAAGAMYGCLDLAERIRDTGEIPEALDTAEAPAMSLRGTCILLMKLGLYDYPVTPQEFPFFYDKDIWIEYLDFLATNRFNYIAFWNGHPFDYFVKLDKYPEAQDGLEPGLLERNHEMLMWLGEEARKRNIWLMFEFYNIHVSVYFAKAHHLPEHGIDTPTPLLEDYTGYCIERFVSEFPNVGLYICPGESLRMQHTPHWINDVIFPAVNRTGKTPPIMIRSWGIDLEHMKQVVGHYPRLYTERKFNVEMIASTLIDPENAEWAEISQNHVVNIHCLGNLEPFRWSPPSYIEQCVSNSIGTGATGIHVYPRKAWRWPYGCDTGDGLELQWHRDWMWFEAWGRYAWNPQRSAENEREYWLARLRQRFGAAAAPGLLDSIEAGGDVLPSIQRLVWLGNDNHTVVTAGITLDQLRKAPGIPFLKLPDSLRIPAYLDAISKGEKVEGDTPVAFLDLTVMAADKARDEAEEAAAKSSGRQDEARRIADDARAVALTARFYRDKMRAVAAKTLVDAGREARTNAAECLAYLNASVCDFRELTELTQRTYESISDVPAWNPSKDLPCPYHWCDILPLFEAEYARTTKELQDSFPNLEAETLRAAGDALMKEPASEGMVLDDYVQWLVEAYQRNLPVIDSAEKLRSRQAEIRTRLLPSLGLDPLPEKTPLNAATTGVLDFSEYTIDKILYEAWPGISVPAHLYLPKNVPRPMPCVLYTCGHWYSGKKEDGPRSFCQGMARHGIAVLIYDPMGQGERFVKNEHGHMFPILAGLSQEGFMAWESIRAIDYLESRPEIDAKRIGMTGASGGGLNTVFTAAIEERLVAVAPVCYPTTYIEFLSVMRRRNWNGGVDLCNQVPDVITYADFSDLMACVAPRPQRQVSAMQDSNFTIAGARETAAELEAIYALVAPGAFSYEEVDAGHGYDQTMRESVYGFFLKTLAGQGDGSPVPEGSLELGDSEDPKFNCFSDGQIHSVAPGLETLVRSILAQHPAPPVEDLPAAIRKVSAMPEFNTSMSSSREVAKRSQDGIELRKVRVIRPDGTNLPKHVTRATDWLLASAKGTSPTECVLVLTMRTPAQTVAAHVDRVKKGAMLCAPDWTSSGFENATNLWMLSRAVTGEQLADIAACAAYLKKDVGITRLTVTNEEDMAETALFAKAVVPEIDAAEAVSPIRSYYDLIDAKVRRSANVYLPGVLRRFDLPDLSSNVR